MNTPQQQDLLPPDLTEPHEPAGQPPETSADRPAPLWLQRVSLGVMVVFCFYVGLLLVVLPWTRYWQENHYLVISATWGPILNSGIARGVISGLGLIDIWIGVSEVIHYRERRR